MKTLFRVHYHLILWVGVLPLYVISSPLFILSLHPSLVSPGTTSLQEFRMYWFYSFTNPHFNSPHQRQSVLQHRLTSLMREENCSCMQSIPQQHKSHVVNHSVLHKKGTYEPILPLYLHGKNNTKTFMLSSLQLSRQQTISINKPKVKKLRQNYQKCSLSH